MNDEIKEIKINTLGQLLDFVETEEKAKLLIDYITNLQHTEDLYNQLLKDYDELQQENERLKELVNPKTQVFIDTQDMEERYGEELYKEYLEKQVKDYKSRCEKAVEKIKKIQQNAIKYGAEHDIIICQELIDTLNGKE